MPFEMPGRPFDETPPAWVALVREVEQTIAAMQRVLQQVSPAPGAAPALSPPPGGVGALRSAEVSQVNAEIAAPGSTAGDISELERRPQTISPSESPMVSAALTDDDRQLLGQLVNLLRELVDSSPRTPETSSEAAERDATPTASIASGRPERAESAAPVDEQPLTKTSAPALASGVQAPVEGLPASPAATPSSLRADESSGSRTAENGRWLEVSQAALNLAAQVDRLGAMGRESVDRPGGDHHEIGEPREQSADRAAGSRPPGEKPSHDSDPRARDASLADPNAGSLRSSASPNAVDHPSTAQPPATAGRPSLGTQIEVREGGGGPAGLTNDGQAVDRHATPAITTHEPRMDVPLLDRSRTSSAPQATRAAAMRPSARQVAVPDQDAGAAARRTSASQEMVDTTAAALSGAVTRLERTLRQVVDSLARLLGLVGQLSQATDRSERDLNRLAGQIQTLFEARQTRARSQQGGGLA